MVARMRIFDAIATAGGFRNLNPASTDDIIVIRGDKRIKFDWSEFANGRNLDQNMVLKSEDKILIRAKENSKYPTTILSYRVNPRSFAAL